MISSMNYWLTYGAATIVVLAIVWLLRVNQLLKGVPAEIKHLSPHRWTIEQLRATYRELENRPLHYEGKLPPRLERRYIVTGGNGLVGGYIVLQLLARGTEPKSIRILDIRRPERNDMKSGPARDVDYVQTDITSVAAVDAAFNKPWHQSIAFLPLTVFHTAAVILASDRSKYLYNFPEAVNIQGTKNVMAAAMAAGADIFSSTSSASISIRPVQPFVLWGNQPKHFWQVLDEQDYWQPLRSHREFFGNYPATKAVAERIVCGANRDSFRTGCIRPANGVYGNPTDNTVGGPLSRSIFPTWIPHVVQSFVHGANVAVAHLNHEAALAGKDPVQAGRPFVVTDPNPPISYSDLYKVISTLSIHPFYAIKVPPIAILILSHIVEWYNLLPYRLPLLRSILPEMNGDVKHLQPGIFSICTHLVGSDYQARKPVDSGGLGYTGVVTTLQGMVLEVLEWNREHQIGNEGLPRKSYTTSVLLADQLRRLRDVSSHSVI